MEEDLDDGLEPLFDYSSVQAPLILDIDDSDEDDGCTLVASRNNSSSSFSKRKTDVVKTGHKKSVSTVKKDDDDDIDSWLPPPPKIIKAPHDDNMKTDPTLLQLRLKRAELLSLAATTPESFEELARKEALAHWHSQHQDAIPTKSLESLRGGKPEEDSQKQEREKIVLMIQDKHGKCHSFKIYMDDKIEKLFNAYARTVGAAEGNLLFRFDGEKVSRNATPRELALENEDIIEVFCR